VCVLCCAVYSVHVTVQTMATIDVSPRVVSRLAIGALSAVVGSGTVSSADNGDICG
jgi:hypothetical protein